MPNLQDQANNATYSEQSCSRRSCHQAMQSGNPQQHQPGQYQLQSNNFRLLGRSSCNPNYSGQPTQATGKQSCSPTAAHQTRQVTGNTSCTPAGYRQHIMYPLHCHKPTAALPASSHLLPTAPSSQCGSCPLQSNQPNCYCTSLAMNETLSILYTVR